MGHKHESKKDRTHGPSRKQHKTKHSHPLRTYSFIGTIVLLAIIIGASYYGSLPRVEHIPDSFQFQAAAWMAFVPKSAQYVSYVDYQKALTVSCNPDFFGTQALLRFYQLRFDISTDSILYDVDIELPPSPSNVASVTISVIKLRDDTLTAFSNLLAEANLPKTKYDGFTFASLLIENAAEQKLTTASVAIAGGYLVVSTDEKAGKFGVNAILDQYSSNAPSLFDDSNVRRGVYSVNAADQPYVALFVGNFQTEFSNTRMIVKSIMQDGDGILVTRSLLFPSSDDALNEFGEAHSVYRDAASYRILDQWLVVSYHYAIDKLRGELTGI